MDPPWILFRPEENFGVALRYASYSPASTADDEPNEFVFSWRTRSSRCLLLSWLNDKLQLRGIVDVSASVPIKLSLLLRRRSTPQGNDTLTLEYVETQLLHTAVVSDLLTAVAEIGFVDSVRRLCSNPRVNVNAKDSRGIAPLTAACHGGQWAVMELLYNEFQANIHLRTIDGETLLMVACRMCLSRPGAGRISIVDWLLRAGVGVNEVNAYGDAAIHIVIDHDEGFGLLRDVQESIELGYMDRNLQINEQDYSGSTRLHYACMLGAVAIVRDLITLDANVHVRDNDGRTPADVAFLVRRRELAREVDPEKYKLDWALSDFPFFLRVL